jgi:hypothetical protein
VAEASYYVRRAARDPARVQLADRGYWALKLPVAPQE